MSFWLVSNCSPSWLCITSEVTKLHQWYCCCDWLQHILILVEDTQRCAVLVHGGSVLSETSELNICTWRWARDLEWDLWHKPESLSPTGRSFLGWDDARGGQLKCWSQCVVNVRGIFDKLNWSTASLNYRRTHAVFHNSQAVCFLDNYSLHAHFHC